MKNHLGTWQNFQEQISKFQIEDLTKKIFFEFVCGWLSKNIKVFGSDVWQIYKFDSLLGYNPSDYPIESSEDSVDEIISRLIKAKPSSVDSIAMMLRDVLWDMLTYKSDIECSNCGDDDFRALFDENRKLMVLSCDICGWAQFKNGEKWSGESYLVPASSSDLKLANYLVKA